MTNLNTIAQDERGNVAVMFSLSVLTILGIVGAAVDYSAMTSARQSLQNAVDSAALAGAVVADKSSNKVRKNTVLKMYETNDFTKINLESRSAPEMKFDDINSLVTVKADARVKSIFKGVLGSKSNVVSVETTVSYAVDNVAPIAVAFVMDVSGSMDSVITGDSVKKIDALKSASEILFDAIENGVGNKSRVEKVLKASLSSYNVVLEPAWTTPMRPEQSRAFGTSTPYGQTARGTIKTLYASGGTNSTPALEDALKKLKAEITNDAATQPFMVFMTDGNNNDPMENPKSLIACQDARAAGVTVFSIAFDAPDTGKALMLKCSGPAYAGNTPPNESVCDKNKPGKKCEKLKKGYYFDAGSSSKLKKAFKKIGDNIGEQNIVIRS